MSNPPQKIDPFQKFPPQSPLLHRHTGSLVITTKPSLWLSVTTMYQVVSDIEIPIDSGIDLSITIDKLRVFINKTLSTESLINQLLIKRVGLSISVDSR